MERTERVPTEIVALVERLTRWERWLRWQRQMVFDAGRGG